MKEKIIFTILLISIVFIAGCVQQQEQQQTKNESSMMEKESSMMEKESSMMEKTTFSGATLAGKSSPVIDFNKADYEKAVSSDKLIVLYFYASWCPICRAEVPELYSAFNQLNTNNVIGFRVNYNDVDTDADESALAQKYQVPYQHTKVFVRNGKQILKSPESWNKERYLTEINKALS